MVLSYPYEDSDLIIQEIEDFAIRYKELIEEIRNSPYGKDPDILDLLLKLDKAITTEDHYRLLIKLGEELKKKGE